MTEPIRSKPRLPARRRLIIAVVIWVLVVRTLILVATSALGIQDLWTSVITTLLFLAIFIPLALTAVKELNDARRRGDEPPPQIPTRRSLIAFGIFTGLFWALTVWFIASSGNLIFPLLPIFSAIWLVVGIRRYRRAGQSLDLETTPQHK